MPSYVKASLALRAPLTGQKTSKHAQVFLLLHSVIRISPACSLQRTNV